ncbi:MAG: single-stranded-DNA-specific exonuclease RecJ [Pseudomonadota bacterium]|nr:MAG: single-stranded-DNA-specific exonuclease RecJ [Pseudomonadota bacterium]
MFEKRIVRRPQPDQPIPNVELHPVLARIYRARNVVDGSELDSSLDRLLSPQGLEGMDAALALLVESLQTRKRILIVADFDADGATSCALMMRALRSMGFGDVHYLVPNRFTYGYGLTPEIVALAAQQRPDLLITVDNGISSIDGVRAARAAGMAVLITDHHLPGSALPPANAIVNPNQPNDTFASKTLAGVGVAFYVMLGLRARLRELDWFREQSLPEPKLANLLDLVALGTVADVVPLDHNNRILVAQGLARINAGHCCAGIRALLEVAGRDCARATATDLGFIAGPRLNAAGRLSDMSVGIECLLQDGDARAKELARALDALNRERREVEADMQTQALAAVGQLRLADAEMPRGLCLFDESWHQGVIGLVAARIKERVHRPVIAFAPASDTELKGSARSIPGLHVRDVLDAVAARHPQLLQRFGGHAMAAGLTLRRVHLEEFRVAFDAEVARHVSDDDLQGKVWTDGELTAQEFSLDLAEQLRSGGPWGQGFPEPVFDGRFDIVSQRVVGARHLKLGLRHADVSLDAIAFNAAPTGQPLSAKQLQAAYRLDVNEYRGNRSLQLIIEHLVAIT